MNRQECHVCDGPCERPDLYDRHADPERWSNHANGSHRLMWCEVAERQEEELARLRSLASILSDLDRCEHGRHEGDSCSGCKGPSTGNAILRAAGHGTFGLAQWHPRRIGTSLAGQPILVPERGDMHKPEAWVAS